MKNVSVYNRLFPRSKLVIKNFDRRNASQITFKFNNGDISVEDYFLERYNYRLKYPQFPVLKGKSGKRESFMPLEVAVIEDNQVAQKEQLKYEEDSKAVNIAAQLPGELNREINDLMGALRINQNAHFQKVNVSSSIKPLTTTGRVLKPPKIKYGDDVNVFVNEQDATWNKQNSKYLKRGKIGQWGIVLVSTRMRSDDAEAYYKRMIDELTVQNIGIPKVPAYKKTFNDQMMIEDAFKEAQDLGVEFLFFISDEKMKLQGYLKMYERRYQIGTQNVITKVGFLNFSLHFLL